MAIEKKEEEKISVLLEDLASLESYSSDLFVFLPLPVCLVSSIGIILEANPSFEKISGYKIDESIGTAIEKIFEKREIENIAKETFEKGFVRSRETNIFTKDKRKVPVSVSATLRKSAEGEIIGYFIGLFDLTEIKSTENELRQAQTALLNMLEDTEEERRKAEEEKNKTFAIVNNFTDGLLVFNKENSLSLINPQAEIFFGIKARDIIDRPILELSTFPTIEPIVALFGKEMGEIFRKEVQIKENLTLEVSTIPIMRGEKKMSTLIILHDVTREKMIEKMKTEFVSISAHQLRTPLAAIKWTLRMFLDGDLGKISPEQQNFLEKTYQSNERMINLINDLLDVTRIEEGRYLYKPIPADFEPIVQFVINSYKEEFEKNKIEIWFNKPEKKIPQVVMDVEKMRLAIQNLLDNAMKYTPPGGKVIVSLKYVKKEIEFSIQDTGVGIPKDQQERIFSKFFRGVNVLRMETEGSGLGLYITKNIIEAHGGKLWFESKEGDGTTFYFTIPLKEEFAEFLKMF